MGKGFERGREKNEGREKEEKDIEKIKWKKERQDK